MAETSERSELARGIAFAQQGHKEAAYASLRRALFTDGDSATLRLWLATVAPTPSESVQHLERAQALEPDNADIAAALDQARALPAAATTPAALPDTLTLPAWALDSPVVGVPPVQEAPALAGAAAPAAYSLPGGSAVWLGAPDPAPSTVAPGIQPHAIGSTLPRAPIGGNPRPVRDYPGAAVAPPTYGVFQEAQHALGAPVPPGATTPSGAVAAPPTVGAPAPPRPAARRTGRRIVLLLLAVLLVLGLFGLAGLAVSTGMLSAALTAPTPAPVQLTATVDAALAAGATATGIAAGQATSTAVPAATAQAEGQFYRDHVGPLLQALHGEDGDIVNSVHQADDGVISADVASKRIESYVHGNLAYQAQAGALGPPVAYREHQFEVAQALTLRAQALDAATQYVQKLDELAAATTTDHDAQRAFDAALTAFSQDGTQESYVAVLRAKQDLEAADSQLDRLRTYADQDHQQFLTLWDQYHARLPDAP